jgi:Methyltransferase domain
MPCCQNQIYNDTFDGKLAQEEIADYRSKGPKKNSLPLINLLKKLNLNEVSLLDIGSGVGAVIFELFDNGISQAVYSDYSASYHAAFQEEVKNRSLEKQTQSFVGDFLETHQNIKKVDLVSLDKVICCYENYEDLVNLSVQKAAKWYAYSIPRDVWWVRLAYFITGKIRILKGISFKSYVHPANEIEKIIVKNDFKKIHNVQNLEWQTVIFEREKGV